MWSGQNAPMHYKKSQLNNQKPSKTGSGLEYSASSRGQLLLKWDHHLKTHWDVFQLDIRVLTAVKQEYVGYY